MTNEKIGNELREGHAFTKRQSHFLKGINWL